MELVPNASGPLLDSDVGEKENPTASAGHHMDKIPEQSKPWMRKN